MTDAARQEALVRDNAYLRRRNAELQEDVTALSAEATRLRQMLERFPGRAPSRMASPLGGGQG